MFDFLMISQRTQKRGSIEVSPTFIVRRSSDLMIKGGAFYAIWDEDTKLWSTDMGRAIQLIDKELDIYADRLRKETTDVVTVSHLWDSDSKAIAKWYKYLESYMWDMFEPLDKTLVFSDTETSKEDYASKKLGYSLCEGDISEYEELVDTLYNSTERRKIEWSIGAIVSGDSKNIQKFVALYGDRGTGKGTVIKIIERLFAGYCAPFKSSELGSSKNQFSLEPLKDNPLVGIDTDGNLSRIEDNTILNSLVAHEVIPLNTKYGKIYPARFNTFLFIASNDPVKITNSRSGLLRRLIDIHPRGSKLVAPKRYVEIMNAIDFELGAIAKHCLDIYKNDPSYYDEYTPFQMMEATNDFFNFMIDCMDVMEKGITLESAYAKYLKYCDEAKVEYPQSRRKFKEELKNYYSEYAFRKELDDGTTVKEYFSGLRLERFDMHMNPPEPPESKEAETGWIFLEPQPSIFDSVFKDYPAQLAKSTGEPMMPWTDVKATLADIDTSKLHYVNIPNTVVVVDLDIRDESGEKSLELNIAEANKLPPTYCEVSRSGGGLHLVYFYDGDTSKLASILKPGVEIKVYNGDAALRRKLLLCNAMDIRHISSGLPLRKERKVVSENAVATERELVNKIRYALAKKVGDKHTATNVQYIAHILDEAYNSGLVYDVSALKKSVYALANQSTNQADKCLKLYKNMKFKSEQDGDGSESQDERLIFFDTEVFPNLFVLCWKFENEPNVHTEINPSPERVETLFKIGRWIGFNNLNYDNIICYARAYYHYTEEQLYNLSQSLIVKKSKNAKIREAKNMSYTDIFDFAKDKMSLKKYEIKLGIHHLELGFDWTKPVPESSWERVAEYCCNDVRATEAVFHALAGDFEARKILAELAQIFSGKGTVNNTTNTLSGYFMFEGERKPQKSFRYRNLAQRVDYVDDEMAEFLGLGKEPEFVAWNGERSFIPFFPEYAYENGVSKYRGFIVGEGGLAWSNPGRYDNVWTFDVASEHPHSMIAEYLFGKYTRKLRDLVHLRILIKHGELEEASKMFDGKLAGYLTDPKKAKALSGALKIVINSIYGLTAAKFDNLFRDERNIDNLVAKRGALFMIDLLKEVQAMGAVVVHIKTDSIKIENPSPKVQEFIFEFGKKYGYSFEIEHKFEKMCLVNKAAYIAKCAEDDPDPDLRGKWTATATQFKVPYVFKTLFSHEPLTFDDFCEVKAADTSLSLDFNENLPEGEHNYHFVGRVGQFTPVRDGTGGGELVRKNKNDDGYSAAQGTKGFRWKESEIVRQEHLEDTVDYVYYQILADEAMAAIEQYCNFEEFAEREPMDIPQCA